jgi:hypothetical protein
VEEIPQGPSTPPAGRPSWLRKARLDTVRRGGESLAGRYFHSASPGLVRSQGHDETVDALSLLNRFGGFRSRSGQARRRSSTWEISITRTVSEDILESSDQKYGPSGFCWKCCESGGSLCRHLDGRRPSGCPNTVRKYVRSWRASASSPGPPLSRQRCRAILREPKLLFRQRLCP